MNPVVDLGFGVWTPQKIASVMKRYTAATAAPVSSAVVKAGHRQLTGFGSTTGQQISSAPDYAAPVALAVGGALLALFALRVGAAWYVGKQFGRPMSGAVVGGVFGAPGLGVLSLFPDRARPNWTGKPEGWSNLRYRATMKWKPFMREKSDQQLTDIAASRKGHRSKRDAAIVELHKRHGDAITRLALKFDEAKYARPKR